MAMQKRYEGSFLDIAGRTVTCRIYQEHATAYTVGDLTFPADQPVLIEWDDAPVEQPVCGSRCTLKLESPGDRSYIDLYSIAPGQIRLDVLVDNALWWSGTLDTEFYEEPYDRGSKYDVSLTFSDFGILDRIPYALSDKQSLSQIVNTCLAESGIFYTGLITHISSNINNVSLTLGALSVLSGNFFDETGEAMTYREVLDGVLQPLALRMIQRGGKVIIYDINALFTNSRDAIAWNGTGQTLGAGTVYNNVKVTFSPYCTDKLASDLLDYGDKYGPEWSNLGNDQTSVKYLNGSVPSGMTAPFCFSWYKDYDPDHRNGEGDYYSIYLTMFLSEDATKCKGLTLGPLGHKFFKIQPVLGGQDSVGVAVGYYTGGHGNMAHTVGTAPVRQGIAPTSTSHDLAFKTGRFAISPMSASERANHWLRLRLETLIDVRYNPFEEAADGNEKGNYDKFMKIGNMGYVPVAVVLYDGAGNALYHWTNSSYNSYGTPATSIPATAGSWVAGEASWGDAWLAYYDHEDFFNKSGLLGWKANRQSFGKPRKYHGKWIYNADHDEWYSTDSFFAVPDGQFIPYPPEAGYLEIRVYDGTVILHGNEDWTAVKADSFFNDPTHGCGWDKVRWQMHKAPELSVVMGTPNFDEITTDDVEYSGLLNPDAKEDLSIDTICGTSPDPRPTARGIYLLSGGAHLDKMTRRGWTDHPEKLLIGTLFSQYSDRRTVLSGDVTIPRTADIRLFEDDAQPEGTLFLMTGETQDLRMDTSTASFREVRMDEYDDNA